MLQPIQIQLAQDFSRSASSCSNPTGLPRFNCTHSEPNQALQSLPGLMETTGNQQFGTAKPTKIFPTICIVLASN